MIVTQSQLGVLQICPYKHYLSYEKLIRPTTKRENFQIGHIIHKYLEYRAKGDTDAVGKALALLDNGLTLMRPVVIAMLSAYEWMWAKRDEKTEVLAVELEFKLPIPLTDHHVAGKIDEIIRTPDGKTILVEHKTAREDVSAVSSYWQRRELDLQTTLYFWAAKQLGYDVQYVLYDVIRVPTLKPRRLSIVETRHLIDTGEYRTSVIPGEEPIIISKNLLVEVPDHFIDHFIPTERDAPPYYLINKEIAEVDEKKSGITINETPTMYGQRVMHTMVKRHGDYLARRELPRGERDCEWVKNLLRELVWTLEWRWDNGVFEQNPKACHIPYTCEYWPLCSNRFDPESDELPSDFRIAETQHEELEGE